MRQGQAFRKRSRRRLSAGHRSMHRGISCPACVLVFFAMLILAMGGTPAGATIVGSAHDLSATTGGGGPSGVKATTEDRICIFCHVPHSGDPVAPLWNRALSSQTYTLPSVGSGWTYLLTTPIQPDGDSRLCLACHDGTLAIGNVINTGVYGLTSFTMTGTGAGGVMPGTPATPATNSNLGTDLSGNHPISIPYNSALVTAKTSQCGGGQTWKLDSVANVVASALVLRPTANTYGGSGGNGVQCTTCHDSHEPGSGFFLRIASSEPNMGTGSGGAASDALCSTCHIACP